MSADGVRARPGGTRPLDGASVRNNGAPRHLWRGVDRHGAILDILVQAHREAGRAKCLSYGRPARRLRRRSPPGGPRRVAVSVAWAPHRRRKRHGRVGFLAALGSAATAP